MRLSFANGEHADVVLDSGAVSIGHADDNTLVLASRDVAPRHARMTVDDRGAVLEVLDASARTHVNARPVREKALLRWGDVLCLGKVTIALKADSDDVIVTAVPSAPAKGVAASAPPRVILRGVSGHHFGKSIAVNTQLRVGRGAGSDLAIDEPDIAAQHASVEHSGESIYLRQHDDTAGTFVNGIRVRNAVVHPGDQIAFGRNYFVVEAPGLPLRGESGERDAHPITQTIDAIGDVGDDAKPQAQHAIWWLIGVAALIALGLLLLIHRGM